MADTARSMDALLTTLFQDGQTGGISAQDMRDLIVSTIGLTGWADYTDGEHSTGSPQSISADTDTIITNDASTKREQELPFDVPGGLYNGATDKILGRAGDGLIITEEFKIRRASGSGSFNLQAWFDIGGAIPPLYVRTFNLPGAGEQNITFSTFAYTLDTWESNGADLVVTL